MPHISKQKIEKKYLDNLYTELVHSFERFSKKTKTRPVLNEFFTATEKVMFSKRLAVVALLSREVPLSKISKALGMSPVTIDLMSVKYESGRYDQLVKEALGKKDIWDILENLI